MKYQAFCIFSTDALGCVANRSASFDPPAPKNTFNFTVLSEGIDPSGLNLKPGPLLEETSYSTSIAAALAGKKDPSKGGKFAVRSRRPWKILMEVRYSLFLIPIQETVSLKWPFNSEALNLDPKEFIIIIYFLNF